MMTAIPRLTVGVPVYNGSRYLSESLDALLAQSFEDFELIISDNASTDETEEICRRYVALDSRVRYVRQSRNLGCAGNHNFLVEQARGELFKWGSDDDLYAQDLLRRCVDALDERPDVVLAHSWTAMIDESGAVTQALEYPLSTASAHAPDRFRSLLFDDGGDDDCAVHRTAVLRRSSPHGSHYRSDRTFIAALALHGPFYQVPDWLYFRRDHPERLSRTATVRSWCTGMDPRRADPFRHPTVRLLAEYVGSYATAIHRSPISVTDKRECYRHLGRWVASRSRPRHLRGPLEPTATAGPLENHVVEEFVPGRRRRLQ
jgi:glycosyltransferase involved in cell wall biosynthesis